MYTVSTKYIRQFDAERTAKVGRHNFNKHNIHQVYRKKGPQKSEKFWAWPTETPNQTKYYRNGDCRPHRSLEVSDFYRSFFDDIPSGLESQHDEGRPVTHKK
jgi:hypothetical protein